MQLAPWSYSKLTAFERCPRQGYARYIAKTLPYVESDAARRGNEVHKAIEDNIKYFKPLPQEYQWLAEFIPVPNIDDVVLAEMAFGITKDGETRVHLPNKPYAWPDDTWFMAKIDYLLIEPSGLAWIIDWKTGRPWENPDQLECYSVLVSAYFKRVENIIGMYTWLKERRVGEPYKLPPEKTMNKLRKRIATVDTSDTPKRNKLCDWCPLESCEYYTGEQING
jgi:PD-(D/E)XK nuclease superfamily